MAKIIEIPSFKDERGTLTVVEKLLPFDIRRVYYIYDVNELPRAGHRHLQAEQALICLSGSCRVHVKLSSSSRDFELSNPHSCLLLAPEDWHSVLFKKNSILLVLASNFYSKEDYICDPI
jgi:hypothetical protein